MDTLPSSEFRKRFAGLTTATTVTVNGHVIGTYQPISTAIDARAVDAIRPGEPPDHVILSAPAYEALVGRSQPGFNSKPFTPVPKKGK